MTTDNRLKQIASVYELPLLLQVCGYRLQVNINEEIDIVKSITFSKNTMIFVFERRDPHQIYSEAYKYCILKVPVEDPSILRFEVYDKYSSFTWDFCLVPETSNHPNILEAFQDAMPIL
jgi:hypothetical protein